MPEIESVKLDYGSFTAGLVEPEFLSGLRARAWARFEELPFPSTKTEEWRYTDLSKIDFAAYTPARPGPATEEDYPPAVRAVLDRSGDRSGIIVQRNGRVVHAELDPALAEQGVVLCSLEQAAVDHPELLERSLVETRPAPMEEKIWSLNLAFTSGGYLLYIPRNVKLDAPVHAFRMIDRAESLVATQSIVVAETGAEASVIDEFVSDEVDAISVHAAIVDGEANAAVDYVTLQNYGRGVRHFSIQHLTSQRDSRLGAFNIQLGADMSRADISSNLAGPGTDARMLALWFGDSDQHFDHHTLQLHAQPNAKSDLLFKGALTDSSTSVFRGLIRVEPGAQLTDAYQTNRNLLLSERANAIALPSLEIEADDVRCSHGATIGQVEDGQLFYLMSRGLTRDQAERLLVLGFFEEVIGRIPMEGVRARVLEAIERKLAV